MLAHNELIMNFTNKQLADKKLPVCDWDLGPGARIRALPCILTVVQFLLQILVTLLFSLSLP